MPYFQPPGKSAALLSCGSAKLSERAPARELYRGPLFRAARDHVEALGLPYRILSGLHGLVHPEQALLPYHHRLPARQRGPWLERLRADLARWIGEHHLDRVELHMGEAYALVARSCLARAALTVLVAEPLAGLRVGHRLAWYAQARRAA